MESFGERTFMKNDVDKKKIIVIGGGTGTSTVLRGLKDKSVNLTAIVSVADSGGSTGRLRDEFGFQPVGDLRQSLAALAKDHSQEWIHNLLLYRFEKGGGLKGHNLGNLILTALQDMAGSTTSALEIAEKIFRLDGKIYPATTENVQLKVEYDDGSILLGEHLLDENSTGDKKIKAVSLEPKASLYSKARDEIISSDMIVIGPGDYYSSIAAALAVEGMNEALQKSKAKLVYVLNLMTRFTQTSGMTASDHVRGVERMIGRSFDSIIINSESIPNDIKMHYEHEREYEVIHDMKDDKRVIWKDVLMLQAFQQSSSDIAHRSMLRHDPKKLSHILKGLL